MYAAQGDKHMRMQFDQHIRIFNEFKDLHACEQLIQKQFPMLQIVSILIVFTDQ
jgi:hypothetical protein